MSLHVYRITQGFYALREGEYGLLRVYGTNSLGFPSTIVGSLEGFHSQTDARLAVRLWLRMCDDAAVLPFSREGIALCRKARKLSSAVPLMRNAA